MNKNSRIIISYCGKSAKYVDYIDYIFYYYYFFFMAINISIKINVEQQLIGFIRAFYK